MKKIFTLLLAVMLGSVATQAQEAVYQPLVREGVRWVNHSQFVYSGDEVYFGPVQTYTITLRVDTTVTSLSGTHQYKRVIHSMYPWRNIFMRESEQKVYVLDSETYGPDEEYLLYDFSDDNEAKLYSPEGVETTYVREGSVDINGHSCRVYKGDFGWLVESVGLVSRCDGDMILPRWARVAGGEDNYGLDHLEDMDGNIIYKAPWYKDPSDIYQPLVREGIRWIYQGSGTDTATGNALRYYAMEIHGDTIINTTNGRWLYYNCYKYPFSKAESSAAVDFSSMEPIAYLKEASKKIFCLDSLTVMSHGWYDELVEPVLYDFSNAEHATLGNPLDDNNIVFSFAGTVQIDGNECLAFDCEDNHSLGQLVQSVGFVSAENGDLLGLTANKCGLSHVIDADGNIIYRGPNWRFFASDLNGDCKVDIADVSEAVNAILGRSDNPGADINCDGRVDIADVNAVINVMLGRE